MGNDTAGMGKSLSLNQVSLFSLDFSNNCHLKINITDLLLLSDRVRGCWLNTVLTNNFSMLSVKHPSPG